jgi:hypothetical protein
MASMFSRATSFNQDLCAWYDKLQRTTSITDIFVSSGCTNPAAPDSFKKSSFCQACTVLNPVSAPKPFSLLLQYQYQSWPVPPNHPSLLQYQSSTAPLNLPPPQYQCQSLSAPPSYPLPQFQCQNWPLPPNHPLPQFQCQSPPVSAPNHPPPQYRCQNPSAPPNHPSLRLQYQQYQSRSAPPNHSPRATVPVPNAVSAPKPSLAALPVPVPKPSSAPKPKN